MSSKSGKLQLKVNPNADRNYFPASEIENFDKKKVKVKVKGQRLFKKALKIRIKAVKKRKKRKTKPAIYSGESKIKIKEKSSV